MNKLILALALAAGSSEARAAGRKTVGELLSGALSSARRHSTFRSIGVVNPEGAVEAVVAAEPAVVQKALRELIVGSASARRGRSAKRLEIKIGRSFARVHLELKDDGPGLDISESSRSTGPAPGRGTGACPPRTG